MLPPRPQRVSIRELSSVGGTVAAIPRAAIICRLEQATPTLLAWLPAALYSLYAKYYILEYGGWRVAARQAGRTFETDLTAWQQISFFREDLLVGFLVIPVFLFVATVLLTPRVRALVVALISISVSLLLFAQVRAYANVGRFLTPTLLSDAIHWGRLNPEVIGSYLTRRSVGPLLCAIAPTVAATWLLRKRRVPLRALSWSAGAAVLLTAAACVPRLPASTLHGSFLVQSARSIVLGDAATETYARLTPSGLIAAYREMTSAPTPGHNRAYWAHEKNADVLFFILETAPSRYLELGGNGPLPAALARLSGNSFVSSQHYSTYPYTNRATFSIFSSWYPGAAMESFIQEYPDLSVPGPIAALAGAGYDTGIYLPAASSLEPDEAMYRALGFRREVIPDASVHDQSADDFETRLARDNKVFALLKRDVQESVSHNRRYAFAFLPQAGHAPWGGTLPNSPHDIPGRGRALMALQDAWLQQLIDLLARSGRLEHTIIVVTGDHGIRTAAEDPSLRAGTIDEYSFRVPLLIYAPRALKARSVVPWVTSHIDIGPTVLDLLGIEDGRSFEQGSPVWDKRLSMRRTFFFANHLFGSDGVYARGSYWMYNHFLESTYRSSEMAFSNSDLLPEDSTDYKWVVSAIDKMESLDEAWAAMLGRSRRPNGREKSRTP